MEGLRNALIIAGGVISLSGIGMAWLGAIAEWGGDTKARTVFFKVGFGLIITGAPLLITAINAHD